MSFLIRPEIVQTAEPLPSSGIESKIVAKDVYDVYTSGVCVGSVAKSGDRWFAETSDGSDRAYFAHHSLGAAWLVGRLR